MEAVFPCITPDLKQVCTKSPMTTVKKSNQYGLLAYMILMLHDKRHVHLEEINDVLMTAP